MKYYSNYINYTNQALGRPYNSFAAPLTSNHVVLFMTRFGFSCNSGSPVELHISTEIVNSSFYMWNATIFQNVAISGLGFSEIIFNSDDVQSSERYYIVYEKFYSDINGGFFEVPGEFSDNFIMSLTSFEAQSGDDSFEYRWQFANQTINGSLTAGVEILPSISVNGASGFTWG